MADNLFIPATDNKQEKYQALIPQLLSLVSGESDFIANVSNVIAALKQTFGFLWVGVYFVKQQSGIEELVLGPFQGPVACTRIAKGKGVCGKCWELKDTILVSDVSVFPGHIACSTDSKSEIVLPAIDKNGNVFLVLDIDSEQLNYFDETDRSCLTEVVSLLQNIANNA